MGVGFYEYEPGDPGDGQIILASTKIPLLAFQAMTGLDFGILNRTVESILNTLLMVPPCIFFAVIHILLTYKFGLKERHRVLCGIFFWLAGATAIQEGFTSTVMLLTIFDWLPMILQAAVVAFGIYVYCTILNFSFKKLTRLILKEEISIVG